MKNTVNFKDMLANLSQSNLDEPTIRFVMDNGEYGFAQFCTCYEHEGNENFMQINLDEEEMPESLQKYMTDYDEASCIPVDEFIAGFEGKIKSYTICES